MAPAKTVDISPVNQAQMVESGTSAIGAVYQAQTPSTAALSASLTGSIP